MQERRRRPDPDERLRAIDLPSFGVAPLLGIEERRTERRFPRRAAAHRAILELGDVCRGEMPLCVRRLLDFGDQLERRVREGQYAAVCRLDRLLEVHRGARVGADVVQREELIDPHLPVGLPGLMARRAVGPEAKTSAFSLVGVDRRKHIGPRRRVQSVRVLFQPPQVLDVHRALAGIWIEYGTYTQ